MLGQKQLPLRDGDQGFLGMDAFAPPDELRPGFYRYAENCRIENGEAVTRKGLSWVLGQGDFGVEFPITFPVTWDDILNRKVYGTGEYRDPDGAAWSVRVFADQTTLLRSGYPEETLSYPTGEEISGPVRVVQAFNQIVLLRGIDAAPLKWDGDFTNDFQDYPGSAIENGFDGLYFQNRLWVLYGRDRLQYSDVLSSTFATLSDFSINEGDESNLVRIFPFNETTLLLFKSRQIWGLKDVYGDPATNSRLTLINSSRGCIAGDTVVDVGPDVFFLSDGGVFALTMVDQTRSQLRDLPISRPIQPIIDRINWRYASSAQAAYFDNKYYLAVPLDDSTINDTVLVYDLLRQAWVSVDTFAAVEGFAVDRWIRFQYLGRDVLGAVHPNGYILAYEYTTLADDNPAFATGGPQEQIPFRLDSRFYRAGYPERKRWLSLRATLETVHPSLTVYVETQGVGESVLSPINGLTRRTDRFVHAHQTDTAIDNAADTWELPHRQDYYAPTHTDFNLGGGMLLQRMQRWTLPLPCRRTATGLAISIRNAQGRVRVCDIEAGAAPLPTSRLTT